MITVHFPSSAKARHTLLSDSCNHTVHQLLSNGHLNGPVSWCQGPASLIGIFDLEEIVTCTSCLYICLSYVCIYVYVLTYTTNPPSQRPRKTWSFKSEVKDHTLLLKT